MQDPYVLFLLKDVVVDGQLFLKLVLTERQSPDVNEILSIV